MIKIDKIDVYGWEAAIRGMRNPMNSWEKSDSGYCLDTLACHDCKWNRITEINCKNNIESHNFVVGKNDHDLMMRLRNAGTDHRKFMRMIIVYMDITAPLYWWKEFDTYKVGTVANSCSTMHKIAEKKFTVYDFSHDHLIDYVECEYDEGAHPADVFMQIVRTLNIVRNKYIETNDKKYWWQMIQLLPSSYNQKRTVMLSYEVLANIYKSRKNHKLDEWIEFCKTIETLPYQELITGGKNNG